MRHKSMKDSTMPTQQALEQAAREAWPDDDEAQKFGIGLTEALGSFGRGPLLALARRIEAQQVDDATVERVARLEAALKAVIQYEGHHVYCGHGSDMDRPCVCGLNAAHEAARAAIVAIGSCMATGGVAHPPVKE